MDKYSKSRKKIKKYAHHKVEKHYLLYVFTCLISVILGIEFIGSLTATKLDFKENILSGTNGVFAYVINAITSDTMSTKIYNVVNSIIRSDKISMIILILLSFSFALFIWIFIQKIYKVISRRVFLEGRIYKIISFQTFFYLLNNRKWIKTSINMFIVTLKYLLWCFTGYGMFVKHYSYLLVPFIAAENPDISYKKAIELSEMMMIGHKWECFIMDLSLIPWHLLGIATMGLSRIFYSNPYQLALYTEFYYDQRKRVIDNDDIRLYLNDTYLYEKADKKLIDESYADIIDLVSHEVKDKKITGFRKILDFFGIKIYDSKYELEYEEEQLINYKIKEYKNILTCNQYPSRLSAIPMRDKKSRIDSTNYLRRYSVTSLVLLFFIFAFGGWIWEVCLHFITDGYFVNKGTLHGPWLPIYGGGCILILTLLNKFRKNPTLEFITIVSLCGFIEYYTSVYLELVHGYRWWDYTGYVLNLDGRICAEGLLVFGIGGMFAVYLLAPVIDNFIRKQNKKVVGTLAIVLITIYFFDFVYSSYCPNIGIGITSNIEYILKN